MPTITWSYYACPFLVLKAQNARKSAHAHARAWQIMSHFVVCLPLPNGLFGALADGVLRLLGVLCMRYA